MTPLQNAFTVTVPCQRLLPVLGDKMEAAFYSTWICECCTSALFAVTICFVFVKTTEAMSVSATGDGAWW